MVFKVAEGQSYSVCKQQAGEQQSMVCTRTCNASRHPCMRIHEEETAVKHTCRPQHAAQTASPPGAARAPASRIGAWIGGAHGVLRRQRHGRERRVRARRGQGFRAPRRRAQVHDGQAELLQLRRLAAVHGLQAPPSLRSALFDATLGSQPPLSQGVAELKRGRARRSAREDTRAVRPQP